LANYFKNYLEGNKNEPTEDKSLATHQDRVNDQIKSMPLIYVKKWMKTKHAFLFRLSNRIVQVDFMDKTRIILSPANQMVCYKNKKGETSQYNLDAAMESDYPEMIKRLKYSKEILAYLKTHAHHQDENAFPNNELKFETNSTPMNVRDAAERTPGGRSQLLENQEREIV